MLKRCLVTGAGTIIRTNNQWRHYNAPDLHQNTDYIRHLNAVRDAVENSRATPELSKSLDILLTQQNNAESLKLVAKMFSTSGSPYKQLGIERDERQAFRYYLQAAEQGDDEAQLYVAKYYINAYEILLQSYKEEGEDVEEEDTQDVNDLFSKNDKQRFYKDPETGQWCYVDPKAIRRQKAIEERDKRKNFVEPTFKHGLSTKMSKVNLRENTILAMQWLHKSANQGNPEAQCLMAKYLLQGEIIPHNLKLAVDMLKGASDGGMISATFDLANLYYSGATGTIVPESDTLKSVLEEEAGCSSMNFETFTLPQDVPNAIQMFHQAATGGYAPALFWLGHSYIQGIQDYLEPNVTYGLQMLQKAVLLNHPGACYYMSLLYLHGEAGLVKDIHQSRFLFLKSVELGHPEALFALADMYYRGTNDFCIPLLDGGRSDVRRAFIFYQRAAMAGHADALYCLAALYYNGDGVEKNLKKAYDCYQLSSSAGNWKALGAMATMAMEGQGIPKDEKYAMHLLSVYKHYEEQEVNKMTA